MANKYKKINQSVRKQQQNDTIAKVAMAIVGIALIILIVLVAYNGGNGSGGQTQGNSQPQNIADFLKRVQTAEQAAKANPSDFNALRTLGDAYYDVGFAYLQANKNSDAVTNFGKALDPYQKALAIRFDINVETDMATTAFYSNQFDIAEGGFKKAIEKDPSFMNAQLNYGIFLQNARGDKAGAKKQFELVANQSKDPAAASKAKQLLSSVQ